MTEDRERRDIWKCRECTFCCTTRTWPITLKGAKIHLPPETCNYPSWTAGHVTPKWTHVGKNSKV